MHNPPPHTSAGIYNRIWGRWTFEIINKKENKKKHPEETNNFFC